VLHRMMHDGIIETDDLVIYLDGVGAQDSVLYTRNMRSARLVFPFPVGP
jgi:hypothetical protein